MASVVMAYEILEHALNAAKLALKLGRVERITRHEDGIRPETDTDHTVMLSVIACALAAKYAPDLNLGLIAQFCIVHELPEAHAGDTPTMIPLNEEQKREKKRREDEAYGQIYFEFINSMPWIVDTLDAYELQDTAEARFVWAIDKIMPKLTQILNGGATLPADLSLVDHSEQRAKVYEAVCGPNWITDLYEASVRQALATREKEYA